MTTPPQPRLPWTEKCTQSEWRHCVRTLGIHLCLWITTQRRQNYIPAHKAKRLWGGGTVRPLITTTLATIPLSSFPGAQLVRSSTSGYQAHQEPLEKQVYEIMGSTMTATLKKPFSQLRSRKMIPRQRPNVTECSPYGRLCSSRTTVWRHVSLSRTFHNTY